MNVLNYPYRNDKNQRYSKQLFWELWVQLPIELRTIKPPFSLFSDKDGCINLGQEYISDADPTGYTTSKRIFGEYGYWKFLMKSRWFVDAKETWDEELDAKLKSEGLAKIRELSVGEDAKALQAAKYLANQEYKKKESGKGRGRPSNEEVQGHLKQASEDAQLIADAAQRIQLVS